MAGASFGASFTSSIAQYVERSSGRLRVKFSTRYGSIIWGEFAPGHRGESIRLPLVRARLTARVDHGGQRRDVPLGSSQRAGGWLLQPPPPGGCFVILVCWKKCKTALQREPTGEAESGWCWRRSDSNQAQAD